MYYYRLQYIILCFTCLLNFGSSGNFSDGVPKNVDGVLKKFDGFKKKSTGVRTPVNPSGKSAYGRVEGHSVMKYHIGRIGTFILFQELFVSLLKK